MGSLSPKPRSAVTGCHRPGGSERGAALLLAIWALVLMSGLGLALMATISSETLVAANFRAAAEISYAADTIAERALMDLRHVNDWTDVLSGGVRSSFVDGAPGGSRTLADGSRLDLDLMLNLANCNKSTACTAANMNAVTAARPWGPNNPRWRLFAYGPLDALVPSAASGAGAYGAVMVGDDPSEVDGDPLRDSSDELQPGAGVLSLRVEAFGPRSAHRIVELTVSRRPVFHLVSWHP